MSGVNNDGNKISQFYESVKTEVKSAVKNLKELIKPKEAARADSKDSNVKAEGKTMSSPPTLTRSGSSESISSASSLGKALQVQTLNKDTLVEDKQQASTGITRSVRSSPPNEVRARIREELAKSPDMETFTSNLKGMGEAITSKYGNSDLDKKLIEDEKAVISNENKTALNDWRDGLLRDIQKKFPDFDKESI